MATLQVEGTTLEYVEQGNGAPVVFVHGSASDYRTWNAQLDEFARRFRVVAYSRRYHWPNETIPAGADYSMDEHVDDLASVLRSLDAAPAHLVGHSYGAFVALLLATREPALVRSLVLAEPPAITLFVSSAPTPGEILRLALRRPRTAFAILKLGARGFGPATAAARRGDMDAAMRIFGAAVLGRVAYRSLSPLRMEQVRANAMPAEFLGSGLAPLDDERLRAVEASALLLNGGRSPTIFRRLLDRLEELLPHTERVEVPDASHIVHEDDPAAYNAAVSAFLAAHPHARSGS